MKPEDLFQPLLNDVTEAEVLAAIADLGPGVTVIGFGELTAGPSVFLSADPARWPEIKERLKHLAAR